MTKRHYAGKPRGLSLGTTEKQAKATKLLRYAQRLCQRPLILIGIKIRESGTILAMVKGDSSLAEAFLTELNSGSRKKWVIEIWT